MRTVLLVSLVMVGCGGGSSNNTTPVKSTPLAGTIDGQSWTAVGGTASGHKAFGSPGEKWIDLSSSALSCTSSITQVQVIGTVPWTAGTQYTLSFTQNLTILTKTTDGGTLNNVALDGRVEIITAPDAGTGTLRIRANAGSGNTIEGQIDVQICD